MFRKVHAFSVIELVVTSMVASIVIGIVYISYSIFHSQYVKNMHKGEAISEFLLLHKALQTDFDSATRITGATDTKVKHDFSDGSTVNYLFGSQAVIREKQLQLDTFKVQLVEAKIEYVSEREKMVKQLSIRLNVNDESIDALFLKSYSAKELLTIK